MPIDTAEDIIERDIKIISFPGRESIVESLKKSPFPLTRKLAENTHATEVRWSSDNFHLKQTQTSLSTYSLGKSMTILLRIG